MTYRVHIPQMHVRVPIIDPPSGTSPRVGMLCGDPDVLDHCSLDPVAFAMVGMCEESARPGYCSRCALLLRMLSDESCARSQQFAVK